MNIAAFARDAYAVGRYILRPGARANIGVSEDALVAQRGIAISRVARHVTLATQKGPTAWTTTNLAWAVTYMEDALEWFADATHIAVTCGPGCFKAIMAWSGNEIRNTEARGGHYGAVTINGRQVSYSLRVIDDEHFFIAAQGRTRSYYLPPVGLTSTEAYVYNQLRQDSITPRDAWTFARGACVGMSESR